MGRFTGHRRILCSGSARADFRILYNDYDGDPSILNGIVQGSDGALYGTSFFGGTNNLGTVFKLNKDGTGFALLHSFTGIDGDGARPQASLTEGTDGLLYGTTGAGGMSDAGTVYKLDKN